MDGADVTKIERMLIDFKDEIKVEFRHQLGIQTENFQHKLDLVVEGHQMLAEKLERVEERLDGRIDCVIRKLDTIAADLSAHRADTEAHPPVYRVKE